MIPSAPLADLVTVAALLVAVVALVTTRSWRAAVRVLLDLLTAAGLIRLSATPSWTALATAAGIVALRQLLSAVLVGTRPVDRARVDRTRAHLRVRSPYDQAR